MISAFVRTDASTALSASLPPSPQTIAVAVPSDVGGFAVALDGWDFGTATGRAVKNFRADNPVDIALFAKSDGDGSGGLDSQYINSAATAVKSGENVPVSGNLSPPVAAYPIAVALIIDTEPKAETNVASRPRSAHWPTPDAVRAADRDTSRSDTRGDNPQLSEYRNAAPRELSAVPAELAALTESSAQRDNQTVSFRTGRASLEKSALASNPLMAAERPAGSSEMDHVPGPTRKPVIAAHDRAANLSGQSGHQISQADNVTETGLAAAEAGAAANDPKQMAPDRASAFPVDLSNTPPGPEMPHPVIARIPVSPNAKSTLSDQPIENTVKSPPLAVPVNRSMLSPEVGSTTKAAQVSLPDPASNSLSVEAAFPATADQDTSSKAGAAQNGPSTNPSPNAQPVLQPSPVASSPMTPASEVRSESRLAPQIENTIETLAQARETGRGASGDFTMRHQDFGAINLRLDVAGGDLRAVLASRDPGFVPAIQVALAERGISPGQEASANLSGRGSDQPSSQPGTHSQSGPPHPQFDNRYGSSTGSGQGSPQPYREQMRSSEEATDPGQSGGGRGLDDGGREGGLFA